MNGKQKRRGAVGVLIALLMIPLLGMAAFAVDYGYLLKVETDLQRYSDAAALAALQDLIPASDGSQDLDAVRAAVRTYVASNVDNTFQVLDADITIGRYDPSTIYSNVTLLNTGIYDAIRVTLRRDTQANWPVSLFFAPLIGVQESNVSCTATAILQKPMLLAPGADVLAFAVPQNIWDAQGMGDEWSIYSDGSLTDSSGTTIPGNWGTLDIGSENNSTSDLSDQIVNGLDQSHLDALYGDGRISTNEYIESSQSAWLQADPGLSSGVKSAVQSAHGETRIVPIYDTNNGGGGGGLEFHVVGWGVVEVISSNWQGVPNTSVTIAKSYAYMSDLRPQPDLSNTTGVIEGAFTSPVLVE